MLVVLFGATGGVGSMLLRHLAGRPDLEIVTCGRTRPDGALNHYEWSFGSPPPLDRILGEHSAPAVAVVYAPIAWPTDEQSVELNLAALASVAAALPARALLISISSLVVTTGASTYYAQLKRRAEEVSAARGGVNLRLGMIDSATAFGQSLMFVKLARTFRIVPVPFPGSRVVLSEESDIALAVIGLLKEAPRPGRQAVEVRSASMTFIDAVRHLVSRQGVGCVCVPVPDAISHAMLRAARAIAPRSWIAQRLQGLQSFSAG
jgi:hypothetical protein